MTGPAGGYAFDVSPGFYIVREAVQPGFAQTTPAGGLAFAAVTAGGLVGGVDFGNFSRALVGTFSGSVYLDGDGDGVRDAGEGGLAGWTVYLDADLNGTLDAGEASTASAADGAYSFTVPAGSYTVREVVPAGYTRTAPGPGSYAVTVAGGAATGYDFGHVADAAPAATISGRSTWTATGTACATRARGAWPAGPSTSTPTSTAPSTRARRAPPPPPTAPTASPSPRGRSWSGRSCRSAMPRRPRHRARTW